MLLRRNPKLEVIVRPNADHSVWAYFPMNPRLRSAKARVPKPGTEGELIGSIRAMMDDLYRRQMAAKKYRPKSATRVLLVLSESHFEKQVLKHSKGELRDHLGHTLLFLQNPQARNDCSDAGKEWLRNLKEQ